MRPNEYFVYDGNVPYSKRVDKVIDWLTGRRGLQTQLAILYMDKVDKAGHEYGPNSEGVTSFLLHLKIMILLTIWSKQILWASSSVFCNSRKSIS